MVQVVEAEAQWANPHGLVLVSLDAEPVKGIQHSRAAGPGHASDLAGRQAFNGMERINSTPATQEEHGRQRDDALDQRGDRGARAGCRLVRGN